jgi:hypothetical protein
MKLIAGAPLGLIAAGAIGAQRHGIADDRGPLGTGANLVKRVRGSPKALFAVTCEYAFCNSRRYEGSTR